MVFNGLDHRKIQKAEKLKKIARKMETAVEINNIAAQEAEKCLNCTADLIGKFCHKCGQERGEPVVSLRETIVELGNEFFKFDVKFFKTFLYLIIKPGRLTLEYAVGRRTRYLQPLKLYLTINFFCFLLAGWFDPVLLTKDDLDAFFPGRDISPTAFNAAFSAALPSALIVIFPLLALVLKAVYLRRKYFYAFHFIFALHYFSFILIAVIPTYINPSLAEWLTLPVTALYLLLALKTAYAQSWGKTIIKWTIIYASIWVLLIIWFFVCLIWSYAMVALSS